MVLKEQKQLRKIRKGDINSFEMLFHQFYPGLCSYAETLVKKEEVAEEVVQDVFYNIWKNRESLRINRSWQSYLYRSVYNNSMMYFRRTRREYQTEDGEAMRDDENFCYSAAWEYKGDGAEPEMHKEPLKFESVELAVRSYK